MQLSALRNIDVCVMPCCGRAIQCEIDRHEVCSHVGAWPTNPTFHLCAGSCVLVTECNSCSPVHERMVVGGSCALSLPTSSAPSSRPCLNGGSCNAALDSFDRFGRFNCSCPPGFAGLQCEYGVDECSSDRAAMAEHVWMKSTRLPAVPTRFQRTQMRSRQPRWPRRPRVGQFILVRSLVLVHDNFGLCRCPSLHSDRHAVEQVVAMDTRVNS